MVQVPSFRPRSGAARTTQRTVDRHEVYERATCPKLNESNLVLSPLDGAAEHVAIKGQHSAKVVDTQYEMINLADFQHCPMITPDANAGNPPNAGQFGLQLARRTDHAMTASVAPDRLCPPESRTPALHVTSDAWRSPRTSQSVSVECRHVRSRRIER